MFLLLVCITDRTSIHGNSETCISPESVKISLKQLQTPFSLFPISFLPIEDVLNHSDRYTDTGIWTSIELTVGVIVACLPAARIFVAEHTSEIIKSMKASGLWSRSCKSDLPSYHKASSSLKRSTFQLTLASRLGGPRLMDAISRELGGDCYPNRRCGSHDELVDMSSHSTDEDLKT